MSRRLLIISHDVVGARMAGPGIRYWELARALAPRLDVTLVAPRPIDLAAPGLATGSYAWGDRASLAPHLALAEAVLANGYALEGHPELAGAGPRLILDLYDPTLLENLELMRAAPPAERAAQTRRDAELLRRQLAAGDAFLCATERQRDLYIGAMLAAGRVTPALADGDPLLRGLIDVVPFGLPAEPPAAAGPALRGVLAGVGPADRLVLWSGGLWDWMDPQTMVRAMPAVVAAAPDVRLVFLAGRHPGAVPTMRAPAEARAIAEELGLLGHHVFFYEEWVPYARRADFLLEADLVVSLHRRRLETAYAALRSRFLDHLWAGLPSLISDGDLAADLVRAHGIGAVVPPEEPSAVAEALAALLADGELRAAQAARARALAPRYAWPALVEPIVALAAAAPPRPAPSAGAAPPAGPAAPRTEPMSVPKTPAPPPPTNAVQMEREQLLHATRNSAVKALESTWRLDARPAYRGPLARIQTLLMERVLWPLLYPILARQQEQNAAVLRAAYAAAELADHQRHIFEQAYRTIVHAHARIDALTTSVEELEARLQARLDGVERVALERDNLLEGRIELAGARLDNVEVGVRGVAERELRGRHLVSQQIREFAEQLAALEEAEQQIRAILRGAAPPPPVAAPAPEEPR